MKYRNVLTVCAVTIVLSACSGESPPQQAAAARPATAPTPQGSAFELAGDAAKGKEIFAGMCASCHGVEGRADGPIGRALRPPPTNFTAKQMDPAVAYKVTKEGGLAAGLAPTMPPFASTLSDQEVRDVVAYIISLYGEKP